MKKRQKKNQLLVEEEEEALSKPLPRCECPKAPLLVFFSGHINCLYILEDVQTSTKKTLVLLCGAIFYKYK